ncbi:hypothetical protein HDU98_005055 [Podochytrium sp. JEL0797]|nr:hypothetical protein HDU98_005055 [Podochytrium sp. JEL0797]
MLCSATTAKPTTIDEYDDDCCCCSHECCEEAELICCDDPLCALPPVTITRPNQRRRTANRFSSPMANSTLQALVFFGLAVSSASAQAGQTASVADTGNSTDACAAEPIPAYDVGFHIAGIFIVLLISGTGIFTTLALGVHAKAPIFVTILQLFKMFGIGIICATAWIHLLPDAFSQFGNPCLPEGWQGYGTNFVGFFGMTAAFLVQLIELAAVDYKTRHDAKAAQRAADLDCTPLEHVAVSGNAAALVDHSSHAHERKEMTLEDAIPAGHSGKSDSSSDDNHGLARDTELGTLLLECGIIFHSLIIGVTLGVTADTTFTSLLIAICFHQMFEGMALGVLIGGLKFSVTTKRLLCLAYPLTTPFGIALGVVMRNFYNANDPDLVLVQGIFNSLAAGILFYNTYTELMSAEISHNGFFHGFTGKFKAACFFAMYLGAGTMALIGNWA